MEESNKISYDCGLREGDNVRLPKQGTGFRKGVQHWGVVKEIDPEVKISLRGNPYQMIKVKDTRGTVNTWASTVLVKV